LDTPSYHREVRLIIKNYFDFYPHSSHKQVLTDLALCLWISLHKTVYHGYVPASACLMSFQGCCTSIVSVWMEIFKLRGLA